jgi:ribosomal protein L13E
MDFYDSSYKILVHRQAWHREEARVALTPKKTVQPPRQLPTEKNVLYNKVIKHYFKIVTSKNL